MNIKFISPRISLLLLKDDWNLLIISHFPFISKKLRWFLNLEIILEITSREVWPTLYPLMFNVQSFSYFGVIRYDMVSYQRDVFIGYVFIRKIGSYVSKMFYYLLFYLNQGYHKIFFSLLTTFTRCFVILFFIMLGCITHLFFNLDLIIIPLFPSMNIDRNLSYSITQS